MVLQCTSGTVLCGDTLRAAGESRLSGREVHDLIDDPEGRFYPFDRAADLASEVLPSLRDRIPVEVRTKRLSARPESPYCLDCQDEIDRKHG